MNARAHRILPRWGIILTTTLAMQAFGQATERTIFVANNGNLEGSVSAMAVHPDGTLALINRIVTGTRPNLQTPCPGCNAYAASLTPDGAYLATGHASGDNVPEQITIFRVNPDGSIGLAGAFSVPGTPSDVAWLTNELLAANRSDTQRVALYRYDRVANTLLEQSTAPAGSFTFYVAAHPSGHYLYVNDSGAASTLLAFRVEANNTLTLIDSEPTSVYNLELAVSHDGKKLYAAGGITYVISGWNIQPDGTLAPMVTSPFASPASASPSNVAFTPDDKFLLIGHGTDATIRSATIEPVTGDVRYTGFSYDMGLQGTLGDEKALDDLVFVSDNSTAIDGVSGVRSFTLGADGSFTENGTIVATGGIAPRAIAVWAPPVGKLGDMNCDGAVTFKDINPFVTALSGPAAYQAAYPDCVWLHADANQDGTVDFKDINPFVALLGS